jgi:hypothetical protein
MSDFSISFASLVKSSNGFFKSEKQAALLLSVTDGGVYTVIGSVYGNSFNIDYHCDAKGVTKTVSYTKGKGFVTTWERVVEGATSVQDQKEIKRLTRLLKQTQKSITERQAAFDAGTYDAPQSLFETAQKRDQDSLNELEMMLNKYQ